jgi:hypothetical protein
MRQAVALAIERVGQRLMAVLHLGVPAPADKVEARWSPRAGRSARHKLA